MKDTIELLRQELDEMIRARDVLAYSFEKCSAAGIRPDLSNDELESFEALTSRFSRLSDIVIQKIFRHLDMLDLEDTGTIRDRINRAEKRGIIKDADTFVQIRLLRNEIAHEYKSESILEIFERVMAMTPQLIDSVERIIAYSSQYFE